MKFIKNGDDIILFSEIQNHGDVSSFLRLDDVNTAGFANFNFLETFFQLSFFGRSTTLKIDSKPDEDNKNGDANFRFTKEFPVRFVVAGNDYNAEVYLHSVDSDFGLMEKYQHYGDEVVEGLIYFTFEKDTYMFANCDYKAVPHFLNLSGELSDDQLSAIKNLIKA